ncbi:MAG: hypothetical protein QGG40_06405 [Myxococcota bacterium]|jgi:hypothetical protein|nr:hypothetical protein [Myxococcota bacterium]
MFARLGAVAWLPIVGCSPPTAGTSWSDQLHPSGGCWEVDLLDGLDEASAAEVHALYDCLDQAENLAPLEPVDSALDELGRLGDPLGVEVARSVNGITDLGIAWSGMAGDAIEALQEDDGTAILLSQVAVEWIYARPWSDLPQGPDLDAPEAIEAGILAPALSPIAQAATGTLDAAAPVGDLAALAIQSENLGRASCLIAGLADHPDTDLIDRMTSDLGDAIAAGRDSSNDRWSSASGDSMVDLLRALGQRSEGASPLEHLAPHVVELTQSDTMRDGIEAALVSGLLEDRLDSLPQQMTYLASVDSEGGSLGSGEDSALLALLRLLSTANTEVQCSVDLWITDAEINLGNLSVAILQTMATWDPDNVESGLDLLESTLGFSLTPTLLDAIVASGVCPALDSTFVDDLDAIGRLGDPTMEDLLVVGLDVLAAVYDDGDEDHVEDLVQILAGAYDQGLAHPVEEALYDLGSSAIASDTMEVLGWILEASELPTDRCPNNVQPIDFAAFWEIMGASLDTNEELGASALEVLQPGLDAALRDDGLALAWSNLGTLLADDRARTHEVLPAMVDKISPEGDDQLADLFASTVSSDVVLQPMLRLLENEALGSAITNTTPQASGPLPFFARVVTGGTLESVLWTLDLVLDALGDPLED